MLDLKQNVQYVKGIGPKRVKVLNSIGIYTLYDLLTYFPRDYEDRTKTKKIIDLVNGEEAVIEATAMSNITVAVVRKNMSILKLTVGDETGVATITWFNQLYLKGAFKIGETDTCKSVAKRFYEIAQTAVSIEASMTLEMQQAQSEIIAETAVMTMGGW